MQRRHKIANFISCPKQTNRTTGVALVKEYSLNFIFYDIFFLDKTVKVVNYAVQRQMNIVLS